MYIFDSHTHSQFSPDAVSDLAGMCEFAVQNGIDGFSVTDHSDCNWLDTKYELPRREECAKLVSQLREQYRGKLKITLGIELAQQDFDLTVAKEAVQRFEKQGGDFLIGSMHRAGNYKDFSVIDFDKIDFPVLLEEYYQQLLTTCKLNYLDILAHITYPLRYATPEILSSLNMVKYDELTREIFKVLIANGKGIELNISGLRQPYGDTFPSLKYIAWFKEMGGEIITIGSDSHTNTDLAMHFDKGVQILRQAGFSHYCYFENRKPQFVSLKGCSCK